jgi:uncharacterized protein (TIGR04222 family)
VVSLVNRGYLAIEKDDIRAERMGEGLEPIETAVLRASSPRTQASRLVSDRQVAAACAPFQQRLEELGLVPDALLRAQRWQWLAVAAGVLLAIGLVKLSVALSRGRTNVLFLVIFVVVSLLLLIAAARQRRTALGSAVLSDLQRLFHGLRGQAEGGVTSDAMLLAAVFGLNALPSADFAEVQRVFAKGSNGSSSCGSSCGSGCGGGGGGGCGGCGS